MWPNARSPPCLELLDQIQGPLFGIHDLVSDSARSQACIRTRRTYPRQNGYQSQLRTLGTLNESLPEDTTPPLAGSIDEIDALNLPPVLSPSERSKGSPSEDSQTRTGSPKKPKWGNEIRHSQHQG